MNILIIGSGAVGLGLGSSMISQGAQVSFYATSKTAKALKENGVKRIGLFNHLSFKPSEFKVYTDYKNIDNSKFDYIFICSKTIANNDISKKLDKYRNILKDNSKIIIFQNGFGNDEPYLRFFNKSQVFCARVITGFSRPQRNISQITVYTEPILLGSLQKQDCSCLSTLAEAITKSNIPCKITNNLPPYLWDKMLYNCTLNPLGAILGVNYGKLTENHYTIDIMNKIITEIFNVIQASPYQTHWKNKEEYKKIFYSQLIPDTYNHYSSTYQDIQKKNQTEIDSLNGKVINLANKYNIKTPVNKTLYNMIKAIESHY